MDYERETKQRIEAWLEGLNRDERRMIKTKTAKIEPNRAGIDTSAKFPKKWTQYSENIWIAKNNHEREEEGTMRKLEVKKRALEKELEQVSEELDQMQRCAAMKALDMGKIMLVGDYEATRLRYERFGKEEESPEVD
jgi:uncharacterized protein with WD repeat